MAGSLHAKHRPRRERFSGVRTGSPTATEFAPFRPLIRNPHWTTIAASLWPRKLDLERFPTQARHIETQPGVKVLMQTQRPNRPARGEAILVHGLEGSADSRYMHGLAQTLLEADFVTHRTNIRSCGGTEP